MCAFLYYTRLRALTSCDAKTSVEVVDNRENGGIEVERNPVGGNEAQSWDNEDEGGVQPVDMLDPVAPSDGSIGNVNLLGIVGAAGPTKRFVFGSAIREGLCLYRLGGRGGRHVEEGVVRMSLFTLCVINGMLSSKCQPETTVASFPDRKKRKRFNHEKKKRNI